ncbi:TRAFAC clade GTPase domain-containing protein [Actinomadura rugatobispora]|uniref:Double-GTPase 1 domain-containing protein n=1 Tax=Actinomadura rugatobispora TaxID=1994 RepID=A0ABW1AB23_9ACTN
MIGHSSAGKTTYVSLMYDTMRVGMEGFSLRAAEAYDHRVLKKAARAIRKGRYPDPSNQRSSFNLVLQHNGSDVFPFTWRDYRGGALSERSVDSEQAKELYEDLRESDAIVVFADAQRLATRRGAALENATLVTHVMRALADRDGAVLPVLVVFTKWDLVAHLGEEAQERIAAPFRQLIEAIDRSESAIGLAVPVACGPEPVNVAVPVLACLWVGLLSRINTLTALVQEHAESADRLAAQDTVVDRFTSWWKGESSYAQLAEERRRSALAELSRLEPLVEPAERLQELLDQVLDAAG